LTDTWSNVSFTATIGVVTPGTTALAFPTGMVTFTDSTTSTSLGTQTVSTTGGITTATFFTAGLGVGTHTITASYAGNGNFLGSGATVSQVVNNASATATTTTVTSSANPQTAAQPVRWTATVTAATGSVNFVNFETGDFSQAASHIGGAIVTGSALSGTYSLQLQRTGSVANYEIRQSGTTYYNLSTAYYRFLFESTSNPGEGGVVNFQDISSGYKAALHLSSANKFLFYGSTGALLGTGTTVLASGQVYAISAMIGSGSNAAWQILINGSVEMSGTGNLGTANNGSLKLGGNGAYTAIYYYDDVAVHSQAYPGPVPTGTVQLMVNGSPYGTPLPLSDGSATTTPATNLAAGNYTVMASYSGDSTYTPGSGSLPGGQTITTQTSQVNYVDFETGDFSQTATHLGGAIVTSPALDSVYSLQLQRTNSVAYCEIRQSGTTYYNLPTAYYRFLFESTSNPGEGGIVNFQDTSSGFKAALHLSSANKLLFYSSAGALLGTGTTVLASGQVYAISAMIGSGSNAAWQILINGSVEMSGTGNLGTANNGSLKLGGNGAYTAIYYYDDVAVDSMAYPAPTPPPGGQASSAGGDREARAALSDPAATGPVVPAGAIVSSVSLAAESLTPGVRPAFPALLFRTSAEAGEESWQSVGTDRASETTAAIDAVFSAWQENPIAAHR
jgi:hypothetical protein